MMNWSKMQLQAINEQGKNILVSAGAGSGKTSVLTARVINLLEKGISINELLILTFTNAAAKEMKERIRKSILTKPNLKDEIAKLDEAFICTFDSFALFLVKKYHSILNLPSNPKITDDTFINILQKECMKEVFDELYLKEDEEFLQLVDTFCVKDDEALLNEFLNIAKKLDLKLNVLDYLDNYVTNYYQEEFWEFLFREYEEIVLTKLEEIKSIIEELTFVADANYLEKLNEALDNLFKANSYEEIYLVSNVSLPRLGNNASFELKNMKKTLTKALQELKDLLRFGNKETLKNDYWATQKNTKILVKILQSYFQKYEQAKQKLGYFDFTTIFKRAYYLVKNNPEILKELKSQFKEIMVDEYQDTNDFQEAFINLLGENNVYMVGDIKQSIYRFRNANPSLFKEKYNFYRENNGGIKIDLIDNFRSRKEVLNNINLLFNPLMDERYGGAKYQEEHQMVFGNQKYEELKDNNYDMEIVKYSSSEEFLNEEIEAFYIANDIKQRVLKKEKIVEGNTLREIKYEDFCILMDRSSSFLLYQKVFNYLGIPLYAYYDEQIKNNIHFQTLKNIFIVINKMINKVVDDEFKLAFTSLARGFLFNQSDEEIYKIVTNNLWYKSVIFITLKPILEGINGKSLNNILEEILDITNYYEKLIMVGNVTDGMILVDYFQNFVRECANFGYTYEDFVNYLNNLEDYKLELKYRSKMKSSNCVKLMSIHASKGLEFPICYYSGLYKKFNISDIKEQFLYSDKYGLVTSIEKEGIYPTFVKELVKNNFYKEEISEKIRLFYVALTRAKEKMILILPDALSDQITYQNRQSLIPDFKRIKARSFADFLYLLENYYKTYIKHIDLPNISKDYLTSKSKDLKEVLGDKIVVEELVKPTILEEQKTFSKKTNELYTIDEIKNMKLGTSFHETLQYIDFAKPRWDLISDEFVKRKIKAFLDNEIIKNSLGFDIYREYEFFIEEEDELLRGIIDLLIVKEDEVLIIDYKLKNISSFEYLKQLKGYKDYVLKTFKLPVKTYLYSIIEEKFVIIDV